MSGPGHAASLAARARGTDRLIGLALTASLALLIAGLTVPIMTVKTFVLLTGTVTLLGGLAQLWGEAELVLFAVMLLFSIVTPAAKLVIAWIAWRFLPVGGRGLRRVVAAMEAIGRWSMLDVFVVALLVITFKLTLVTDVLVQPGIWCFTASVVLSLLATLRIAALSRRAPRPGPESAAA